MYLERLLLRNFRTYLNNEVYFAPTANLIQGKNGEGKTNLLEAVHLISTGRSFRTSNLADLIAFGCSFFYLEASFKKQGISHTLTLYYDLKGRKVQHNGTVYPTLHSLLGVLPSILVSPNDLSLIMGAPLERRRLLDLHISQTDPSYLYHLGRYFRAMKQRNHLLKTAPSDHLALWEQMMALSAQEIVLKRKRAIQDLVPTLNKWVSLLSQDQEELSLHYHPSPASLLEEETISDALKLALEKTRPKEKEIGNTLIGPHRDDLSIHLSRRAAKQFSSEGQKRGCIAAIRFAEWETMAALLGDKPLLGIDDFGIQLDATRRQKLKSQLSCFGQIFLTTPEVPQQDLALLPSYRLLRIEKGSITPAGEFP